MIGWYKIKIWGDSKIYHKFVIATGTFNILVVGNNLALLNCVKDKVVVIK